MSVRKFERYHIEALRGGKWQRLAGSSRTSYREIIAYAARLSPTCEERTDYRIMRVEVTTASEVETYFKT